MSGPAGRSSTSVQNIGNIAFPTTQTAGEVAKRSNAADCKSVALAASKVRVLPSPPSFARVDRERASDGKPARRRDSVKDFGGLARRGAKSEARERVGGSNSVVESQPSKLLVAGSIPVSRSIVVGCEALVVR